MEMILKKLSDSIIIQDLKIYKNLLFIEDLK